MMDMVVMVEISDVMCISLHFDRFVRLKTTIPNLKLITGVRPADLTQPERARFSPELLRKHPGNCGATTAHMRAWDNGGVTVVIEDDADIPRDFMQKASDMIHRVTSRDPEWNILLFGFAADISCHPAVAWNNSERVTNGGIVRVHWFTGMWAYAVRAVRDPTCLPTHFEKTLEQQLCETPDLKIYGCVPNIAFHPGTYRLTPWNITHCGRGDSNKSDTR
jgi:hypothetical protein